MARSLEETLVALHLQWPRLRIAVLLGAYAPEYQPLLKELAAYQIYNCLIAEEFQFPDLVNLVTTDWTWDAVKPYLGMPHGMTVPPQATLPERVVMQRSEPREPAPSTAIAVLSAQGRMGKTGFIANTLAVLGDTAAVGLDLDVAKPTLPLYFRAANDPLAVHLQQLLTALSHPLMVSGELMEDDRLTPHDKQEIREYLHHAVTLEGVRIVPGPLRHHTMTPHLPRGLAAEMIRQAKLLSSTVWVDAPGAPDDPVWEEIVRTVDCVVVLTTPDSLAVLETLLLFERLDRLRVPRSAIRLIVNRVGAGGLAADEIAQVHLKHTLFAAIPDQPKLWEAAFQSHRLVSLRQRRLWDGMARAFLPGGEPSTVVPISKRAGRRVARATS